ncbi:MAG: oligosaccharide flippase family protein [Sulfitobacter sp.]
MATKGSGNAALSIICLSTQQASGLIITLLAAGFLSTSEYGVYTLAVVFTEFVIMLTYTGFFHFVVNSEEEDDLVLSTMFWIMTAIGLAGGLVLYFGAAAIAGVFDAPVLEPVLQAFGLMQPFASAIGWATAALTRAGLMRSQFLSIGASNVGALAVGSALLVSWQSVFALVAFRASRLTLQCVFFGLSIPKRPKLIFDMRLMREAAHYSVGLYGSSLLTFFANFGTDLVLAGLFSTAESGLYRFANRLAQATVEIVAQPYRTFALRHFGDAARGRTTLAPVFAQFLGAGTLLLGGFAATLFVLGAPAVEIMFRPEYAAAIVTMQALTVRAGARVGQLIIQPVFAARKRTTPAFYYNLGLTLAILGTIIVCAPMGLEALALSQALVQVLSVPLAIWVIHRWAEVDTAPALNNFFWALGLVGAYGIGVWVLWQATALASLPDSWRLVAALVLAILLGMAVTGYAMRRGILTLTMFGD